MPTWLTNRYTVVLPLALALMAAGCEAGDPSEEISLESRALTGESRSSNGAVASAQPLATAAGLRMLEAGGNAVDAAIATAFALTVVESSMNSLGGRTQILIRLADGTVRGIDATTQAPLDYDYDTAPRARYGYPTVGLPGTVMGLTTALEKYGTLPLHQVMEPAIEYARGGYALSALQARSRSGSPESLAESEGSRDYFLKPDGQPYAEGELFVQGDLAVTLEAIAAEGADVFYRGWIAERIASDMAAHGAAVSLEALAQYEAVESEIVSGSYRGYDLDALWMPSFGAITIEILQILETLPPELMTGATWAPALSEAVRVAYQDRGDQASLEDARRITSKEWAAERASEMRLPTFAMAGIGSTGGTPDGTGTVSFDPMEGPPAWTSNPGHTTHLSAASPDGTVVALTQTIGPAMGSQVAAPGLGFLYAATLGGYLGPVGPGERAASHISPLLVSRGGEPVLAIGAAGGGRIPPAIVAAVSRFIDQGMTLEDALQAPRVYPGADQTFGMETETGLDFGEGVMSLIEGMGFSVEEEDGAGRFGRVHAVAFDAAAGEWLGAADPDGDGAAGGPVGR